MEVRLVFTFFHHIMWPTHNGDYGGGGVVKKAQLLFRPAVSANWSENTFWKMENSRLRASATFSAAFFSAASNCWIPCVWLAMISNF